MKLWKDMTPEEKGALLLAYHEGKVIEWCYGYGKEFYVNGSSAEEGLHPVWADCCSYRVKPEPKKPREWWVHPYVNDVSSSPVINYIHVREVLE